MIVLPEEEWTTRREAHRLRVDAWIRPHLDRRRRGQSHPVFDFLFTYYSFPPARLRRWHPGAGVLLTGGGAEEFRRQRGYASARTDAGIQGVTLDPAAITTRSETIRWIRDLLARTSRQQPHFGCLGLHEWAMVYRLAQDQVRHPSWPLRLGPTGTDEVVEQHRIRCTHFDAYRFFTEPARPRNTVRPTRERQPELEQGGCLHTNMDLYKWAYKLAPFVASELVADCFALAREVRELDMRASPYDLTALGYEPVAIETPEGKAEYAAAQRAFARRAAGLRDRLRSACDQLLGLDQGE